MAYEPNQNENGEDDGRIPSEEVDLSDAQDADDLKQSGPPPGVYHARCCKVGYKGPSGDKMGSYSIGLEILNGKPDDPKRFSDPKRYVGMKLTEFLSLSEKVESMRKMAAYALGLVPRSALGKKKFAIPWGDAQGKHCIVQIVIEKGNQGNQARVAPFGRGWHHLDDQDVREVPVDMQTILEDGIKTTRKPGKAGAGAGAAVGAGAGASSGGGGGNADGAADELEDSV